MGEMRSPVRAKTFENLPCERFFDLRMPRDCLHDTRGRIYPDGMAGSFALQRTASSMQALFEFPPFHPTSMGTRTASSGMTASISCL